MWTAAATRQNLQTLQGRGVHTIGPGNGLLACGDVGEGRMSEPADIVAMAERLLAGQQDYAGLRILVTAGPTRERIDPVRYIGNDSSGKMGYAIAEGSAKARGAEVTFGFRAGRVTGSGGCRANTGRNHHGSVPRHVGAMPRAGRGNSSNRACRLPAYAS